MKFYVTQITRVKGEPTATLTTEKDDKNEAIMLWHQICASTRATANMEYAQNYVKDEAGADVVSEIIPVEAEIPPEPTPTPVEG